MEANNTVEMAAVAPMDNMNRLPLRVMNAMPTAAIPTAAIEYMMALMLVADRKLSIDAQPQISKPSVTSFTAVA
ncbi:hypothetical protein D9M72_543880 [compost metagenome]